MSTKPTNSPAEIHKAPRLYVDTPLSGNNQISLDKNQSHYLINVLRKHENAPIRVFNGIDGEWLCTLTSPTKKAATLKIEKQLKNQPQSQPYIGLIFSPIKKHRMDFLIEKAVELGVTDLYPALMSHTENRKIKPERINAQLIEAAEQCERMTIPTLHELTSLDSIIQNTDTKTPIYWAAERFENTKELKNIHAPCSFLIGPEGGFDQSEQDILSDHSSITPISLGDNILRAETAALFCLSQI